MLVKIGVSFSAREARELVAEIDNLALMDDSWPMLVRLRQKLASPLAPDKIPAPAQDNNPGLTD